MSRRYNPITGNLDFISTQVTLTTIPVSNDLVVNVNRTDSYTADGSMQYPFKTFAAAFNKIVANADNSAGNPYQISIVGPARLTENLILENALVTDLYIRGVGAPQSVFIDPASGNSLRSITNNGTFHLLVVENISFVSPVVLTGDGSHFFADTGLFKDCVFYTPVTVTNCGDFDLDNCSFFDTMTIDSSFASLRNGPGSLGNMVFQNGATIILDCLVASGNVTNDATSLLVIRSGSRIGTDAGSLTSAGTLQLYTCFIRSHITNSGTLNVRGGNYRSKDLINSGSITKEVALDSFDSFKSTEQTATGSSQNIAHGLGYVPTKVIVFPTDTTGVALGFVVTEGVHDATNVKITGTSGLKYKVVAF
jgi:hypothetical protein